MAVRDPHTEWLRVKIYRSMTPERRLEIVCSLNQTMRELALSDIREKHPIWTPEQVRRELRRRLLPRDLFEKVEKALQKRAKV